MKVSEVASVVRGLRETIEKMRDFILKQTAFYSEIDGIIADAKVFTVGRGNDVTIRCASRQDRARLLKLLASHTP